MPTGSSLGKVLSNWQTYGYKLLTRNKLRYHRNTAWPMHILDSGEFWPLNGSLNYYTVLQLELFCQRFENGMKYLMYRYL